MLLLVIVLIERLIGAEDCRVAHASRVLVSASRRNNLFLPHALGKEFAQRKVRDGATPSPARETRAPPGVSQPSLTEDHTVYFMDWLVKNYERVALIAGILVLLASAATLFRSATSFSDQFADLLNSPVQRPASPPGKANEVQAADHNLNQPPQWTFSGRSGLFVPEKHFIGANGEPATLQTTEVHPPVPNEWFEQFGLAIADADVLDQDPDGDGFTNFDEWQGHTNPTDKNSHPDYLTKLKLKGAREEPFSLVFASRTGQTFQINDTDLKQPTQFVKVGDVIAGTHFRVVKFTEKAGKDKYGNRPDVSELTLENTETHEQLALTKERVAISPQSVATFVYSWKERHEFVVKKDQEFSLPPETDIRYKLVDVQPNKAVIVSSKKPDAPIEIGLLVP